MQRPRDERRRSATRGRTAVALVLACVLAACSGAPSADPANLVPAPAGAALTIGAGGPAMDNGLPFLEFRSPDEPRRARAGYDAVLRDAGFARAGEADAWTAWRRADVVVWVSVSESGPPTSILVRYAAVDPASARPSPPVSTGPDGTPGLSAGGTTPEPATRPGGPFAPPGQGGRPAQPPVATREPRPTREPAPTDGARPTQRPKPTPKPAPTPKPRPSERPGPTPKPRPTPKPKPTRDTGTTPPGRANQP